MKIVSQFCPNDDTSIIATTTALRGCSRMVVSLTFGFVIKADVLVGAIEVDVAREQYEKVTKEYRELEYTGFIR